jgi:SPX domain protein involved in polyphosphate accumulation
MHNEITKEIIEVLDSIEDELRLFSKKVEDSEEKTTDQFVGDTVSNLERRERFLKNRLQKVLTQNDQYHIPGDRLARVLQQITHLRNDSTTKAKMDMLMGQQTAFWNVLRNIQDALENPTKIETKAGKVEGLEGHSEVSGI